MRQPDQCIWVSGPTGAGKSTFAAALCKTGYGLIEERIPENLFKGFFSNQYEHCYALQEAIIRSRYEQWLALQEHRKIAFDRSISEDIWIFCQLHVQLGFLTALQFENLLRLTRELEKRLPQPDVIVYLNPSQAELRRRIAQHPPLIQRSLDTQLKLYADWFEQCTLPKISIDNSHCSAKTLAMLIGQ